MPKLNCLITMTALILSSLSANLFADDAAVDKVIADQQAQCAKNSSMEWSATHNRCVTKVAAKQTRDETKACDALTDIAAKKACHMNIATKNTGLSADPEKLGANIQSKQTQSMMVNGAAALVAAINFIAKDGSGSNCMSKSIFGVTAIGGIATDVWMKMQAKKKLKALQDKFIVEDKDTSYATQVKALEYLKEEQKVIKDIASQEKKRQMLLMLGYGAAAATAGYELFTASCADGKPQQKGDLEATAKADAAPSSAPTPEVPSAPAPAPSAVPPANQYEQQIIDSTRG